MQSLEYSFIRAHKGNEFILFIQGNNTWLEKDIDLQLKNNQLIIEINSTFYTSETLEDILISQLTNQHTQIILVNEQMEFLSKFVSPPFNNKV